LATIAAPKLLAGFMEAPDTGLYTNMKLPQHSTHKGSMIHRMDTMTKKNEKKQKPKGFDI
jgi:hypothetical protein